MELNVEIKKEYGTYGPEDKGWQGEVNLVSWHGNPDRIDIRSWKKDHSQCSRGITLPIEVARELGEILIRL